MYYPPDTAGCWTDQLALALRNLPATRADAISARDDDRSSDDDFGDEGSSDDDSNYDEHLRNNDDGLSSSRKYRPWSQEDKDRLRKWKKEEDRPWDWICRQFPRRSPGAVRVRLYTKLREKV